MRIHQRARPGTSSKMKCLALVLTIERVWATLVMILFLVFVRRNEQHLEAEVEQALRKYDILSWLKDNA